MSKALVGIVDYGMGNLLSVANAVEYCGYTPKICVKPEELNFLDKIILPGVGAFRDCLKNLRLNGFIDALNEKVLVEKKQILGICLGMQAMAKLGYEGGVYEGLAWIDAEVKKIIPQNPNLRIPHIGWNDLKFDQQNPLLKKLPNNVNVYFVHSFHLECKNKDNIIATAEYGVEVTAAINVNNIFGTQFHPEKSQEHGLRIIQNFLEI